MIFGELIGRYRSMITSCQMLAVMASSKLEAESCLRYGITKIFELSHSHTRYRYHEQGMTITLYICGFVTLGSRRSLAGTSWSWSFGNGMGYCGVVHQ